MTRARCAAALPLLLVVAATLAGCGDRERDDLCTTEPPAWQSSDFDGFQLRCALVPELCGLPVTSTVNEPDLQLAIDVVLVGDGYTAAAISDFRERVQRLVEQLTEDGEGIVGRDPTLFNFHRVDLVSPSADVAARPLRSCVSTLGGEASYFLIGDDQRAARAAASAPAADVVVVIVDGSRGSRGPVGQTLFGTDVIRMAHDVSHRVLTHELGHALVGLGDEYVEFDRRHYLAERYVRWTSNPLPPNLSLSPDGDWEGIASGALEGGGRYARGVYRPSNTCRMRDAYGDVPFCPVCSRAVDGLLSARRGAPDGPPRCGLALGPPRATGARELVYFGRDGNGLATAALSVDGALVAQSELATFRPLASRLPVWFEITSGTTGAREARIRCADGLGESSEAAIDLAR